MPDTDSNKTDSPTIAPNSAITYLNVAAIITAVAGTIIAVIIFAQATKPGPAEPAIIVLGLSILLGSWLLGALPLAAAACIISLLNKQTQLQRDMLHLLSPLNLQSNAPSVPIRSTDATPQTSAPPLPVVNILSGPAPSTPAAPGQPASTLPGEAQNEQPGETSKNSSPDETPPAKEPAATAMQPPSYQVPERNDGIDFESPISIEPLAGNPKPAAEDIHSCRRQAEDFMALARFQQALAIANGVADRHPNSQDAQNLLSTVHREASAFAGEKQTSLFADLERAADMRQWRKALELLTELLESYPTCPQAQQARDMLETIQANAHLEEVRQLRDKVKDLVSRKRYAEAADVAETIVKRFPDTQAARDLLPQIGKMRSLG